MILDQQIPEAVNCKSVSPELREVYLRQMDKIAEGLRDPEKYQLKEMMSEMWHRLDHVRNCAESSTALRSDSQQHLGVMCAIWHCQNLINYKCTVEEFEASRRRRLAELSEAVRTGRW